MAQRQPEPESDGVKLATAWRTFLNPLPPKQLTRTERVVSDASWRAGRLAGLAFSWVRYATRNAIDGFRDGASS